MKPLLLTAITALSAACVTTAASAAPGDDDALRMANAHGCMACHHVEPGATGLNGAAPTGPAWRDVAARYKSVKGAQQQLTATIMTGSSPASAGASPYKNHWEGKVSGPYMPSHRAAIAEADAARLVAWILALDAPR
ncbi:c-type cytochrome [Hydrogenophaga sp.]|uniref:c-type cytochrome n=1 Tax=Hydrogenophaga sp. TaxID=1904254 RepID=UPI003F6B915A